MSAPVVTRTPVSLRIARGVIITQTGLTALATAVALLFALSANRADAAARRSGHPNLFDGLGEAVGLVLAAGFGVVTLVLLVPAVGLCLKRTWGLVTAALVEGTIAVFAADAVVRSGGSVPALVVLVPAAAVLILVTRPECREWCRRRALA